MRHGGLHPAYDGGVLRCVLTYLANSRYVAYLDDDNWWADNHLSSMLAAIKDHHWAYALRWFVHPDTSAPSASISGNRSVPGAACSRKLSAAGSIRIA